MTQNPRMTPEHIRLVQESFALFRSDLEQFADVLYMELFNRFPEIQYMFRGDRRDQGRKLGTMLDTIVDALDWIDDIKPILWNLGRRHLTYGVREKDYRVFGEVLMWTVEKFLYTAFTPEVEEAWRAFYAHISEIMVGRVDHRAAPRDLPRATKFRPRRPHPVPPSPPPLPG